MKEKLRYYLGVYGYKYRLEIRAELAGLSRTFCWLLMIPLSYLSGFYVLQVIVKESGGLHGWGSGETAFLFGLSMFSHGLQDLFFIRTRVLDELIQEGEFDRMLLTPLGIFTQFCFRGLNLCGLYDLVPGILVFGWGCMKTGFSWNTGNVLAVAAVIAGGTMISLSLYTVTGCLAFRFAESAALEDLNIRLIGKMTSYPLTIYPKALQMLFTFLIPLGFISFYPACGFLGKESAMDRMLPIPLETPALSLLAGLAGLAAARALLLFCIRRRL